MSYESDDPSTRLAAVRAAIQRCLTSQAYTVAGRQQTMAQLNTLRAMEKELQEEVGNTSDSMCSLGIQTRPSL